MIKYDESFDIHPGDQERYSADWSGLLETSETLTSSSWSFVSEPAGNTAFELLENQVSDTATTLWIRLAATGSVTYYFATNEVTTSEISPEESEPRTKHRTIRFRVVA